jgi:hypothetical protein
VTSVTSVTVTPVHGVDLQKARQFGDARDTEAQCHRMTVPRFTDATTLADFLATRGELTKVYAALCTVYWLTVVEGRADVSTGDVRAAYPHRRPAGAPRLTAPADALRRATAEELLERVPLPEVVPENPPATGGPATADRMRYRLTWLGRAVVEALPDLERVGTLRGLSRAAPGRTRAGVFQVA